MDFLLTPTLLFAAIGGAVGGFRAAIREYPPRGLLARLSDFLVGLSAAVAISHYTPAELPLLSIGYGMVAGTLTAYTLDILHEFVPRLVAVLIRLRLGISIDNDKDDT